jgi:polysaccharide biosynthesis protein PslE
MHYIAVVICRRKWWILSVFFAVALLVTALAAALPKQYEARMKVLVKHERPEKVVSPQDGNAVIRAEVTEEDVNAEVELLKSAELMKEVARRTSAIAGGHQRAEGDRDSVAAMEATVQKMLRRLSVTPLRKTSIIQVTYTSDNAALASSVLQTLGELYLQAHLRVHKSPGTYEFFKTQAAQHEQQLSAAQSRLDEFRQRNNVVLLSEQKDLLLRRVMETEQASNEASAAAKEASGRIQALQAQIASLDSRVVTQSRVVPNQYSVERLHTMLTELQNRRTELTAKFNADDRLVQDIEKQITDTTAALERARAMTSVEQTTDLNPIRQALEGERSRAELSVAGLAARAASLGSMLQGTRAQLARLNAATTEHDALSREIKQLEESVVLYRKKREEARISDSLDEQKFANVSIFEPATKPHLSNSPNLGMYVLAGCVLALFAGAAVAFAADMSRRTFDTAEELQAFTGVIVLADVPLEGV